MLHQESLTLRFTIRNYPPEGKLTFFNDLYVLNKVLAGLKFGKKDSIATMLCLI